MPEHLRALMVVLALSVAVLHFARPALVQVVDAKTFSRWRMLWVFMTLALFLAHSFWLYVLMVAAYALVMARREAQVMGVYFLLLFVAPPAGTEVPGMGLVNYILNLNQYRLLALVLLLPAAIALFQRSSTLKWGKSSVDWMVLAYLLLISLLRFREANLTSGLRDIVTIGIDVFLPYYVASRSLRSLNGFKYALTGFVMSAMVLAAIAVSEVVLSWQLYFSVLNVLGLNAMEFGGYLYRGAFLRPNATVGNSIVLGYVLMVALGFFFFLKEYVEPAKLKWLGAGLLLMGVASSLSRGPWVGAGFLLIVYLIQGPNALKKLTTTVLVAVASWVMLNVIPMGQVVLDMLPFVGTVDEFNVEYRANLLTSALPVIERNLWLGSVDYLRAPELQVMVQGDGIIDIVNTYVGVVLNAGLIGLSLFVGAFVLALKQVRAATRKALAHGAEAVVLGRALSATLAAVMLVIYTVSSIFAVSVIYWTVLGVCVAYASLMKQPVSGPEPSES
ncbi:MAG: ligase [Betaproteobacteria bacterium HGW-Betaproteobacteria-16]|nr:MAG: ligase [Betaproteobacteria bacterium HGW-Betaproteobacteria-16]